jgi:hypothetical protein
MNYAFLAFFFTTFLLLLDVIPFGCVLNKLLTDSYILLPMDVVGESLNCSYVLSIGIVDEGPGNTYKLLTDSYVLSIGIIGEGLDFGFFTTAYNVGSTVGLGGVVPVRVYTTVPGGRVGVPPFKRLTRLVLLDFLFLQ